MDWKKQDARENRLRRFAKQHGLFAGKRGRNEPRWFIIDLVNDVLVSPEGGLGLEQAEEFISNLSDEQFPDRLGEESNHENF
jgi:hypothetical protein